MATQEHHNQSETPPQPTSHDREIPDYLFIVGIIVLSLLACIPLFNGKFFHTHETLSPIIRLASLYKYFGDGQILTRWIPDLSRGYGLPLFNFYPPLFYFVALIFAFAGFGFVSALNYALVFLWITSGLSMYLFTREFFGKYGAFVSAIAYVYAPYHIVDVYVRGAVAEFSAFPLFPLILWSFYKQTKTPSFLYIVCGAVSFGLLLLSHNIMALIFTPVLIAYMAFLYFISNNKVKTLMAQGSSFVLGMMLSAFFWLPAILEMKFVQTGWLLTGYLDYHNHFAFLDQLIYSPWGYGRSEPGRADSMSFQVGIMHLILSLVAIFLIKKVLKKSRAGGAHIIFFLAITPIILFFISQTSLFLWENLPLLKFVQFSWRFLSLIIVIVSFLAGSLFLVIKKKRLRINIFIIVTALIVAINLPYCKSKWYFDQINDELKLPLTHINNPKISAFSYYLTDFTPAGVKTVPRYPSPQQLTVLNGDAAVKHRASQTTLHQFIIEATTDSKLRFHIFYFPGWELYIDGVKTDIDLTDEYGLIDFNIAPGTHQVRIQFKHTPLRATAIFISLFALLLLVILLILEFVERFEHRRNSDLIRGPPQTTLPQEPTPVQSRAFLIPAGIFIASLAVYWKTLCPSVYGGDSGEVLAAASVLGIAHPTGFPLYMLASKLFSLILPVGDFAYRVNILTAICGALTVCVTYLTLKTLTNKTAVCAAGALGYAFSSTLWSHATAARVYTMAALFMALSVYAIILWSQHRKDKYFYYYAIALALGAASHVTMILTIPMAIAIIVMTDIKVFARLAIYKAMALAGILIIALHLYIPIAASQDPLVNWGNPIHFDSFLHYITQQEYKFKIIARTARSTMRVFFSAMKLYILDFTPLGFFTILCGIIGTWRQHKKILIALACMVISNLVLMVNYGNEEDLFTLFRYLFPSYVIMAVWFGLGLCVLADWVQSRFSHRLWSSLLLVALPLVCLVAHYHQNDRSKNYIVRDYAENILNTVAENSFLFTVGDAVSGPIQYLQIAEGARPDVIAIDRSLLTRDWYCLQLLERFPKLIPEHIVSVPVENRIIQIIEMNMGTRPIFATFALLEYYENIPYGLVYKIAPKGTFPDIQEVQKANDTKWREYSQRGLLDPSIYKDYMLSEIVNLYGKSKNNLGLYYSGSDDAHRAIEEYEQALRYNPVNFATLFNLGQLLKQVGRAQEGEALLKKAILLDPDFLMHHDPVGGSDQSNFALLPSKTTDEGDGVQHHIQTGVQFGSIGNHERAIEEFQKALQLKPDSAAIHALLGNAYMNVYAVDAAIDMYTKAISLDSGPVSANAYLNLGAIYANNRQDYPTALTYLEKYIEVAPNGDQANQVRNNILQIKTMLSQSPLPTQ